MTSGHPARRAPADHRRKKVLTKAERVIADVAIEEGREQMRKEVLSYLEQKYMQPGVERGSVEGNAILAVAKDLSEHLGPKDLG